jgi:hypothetical protein
MHANRKLAGSILLCLLILLGASRGEAQGIVFLDHPDYVTRLSMDLRGNRPPAEDLSSDPSQVDALIDRYMSSSEFSQMMMWLANDMFLTRTDFVEYFQESYEYNTRRIRYQVAKAVGEEPLRLFEYIVRNDLPLTELVTADYTVANSTLAFFWNIDYPGPYKASEWLRGRYKDDRPHAGILSQTSMFYRYTTTYSNKQRHRANELCRILLGDDHLLRNVAVELRQRDPDQNLVEATLYNPACVSCHSSLDGIVAFFNGYAIGPSRHSTYARENFAHYSQQGVDRAMLTVGREPSFYGYPGETLKDLGHYIASDPRFARTMSEHFYRFFLHRDLDYRDRDLITSLATVLKNNNFSPKSLIKAIVKSDEYRAVGAPAAGKSEVGEVVEVESLPVAQTDAVKVWSDFQASLAKSVPDKAALEQWNDLADLHRVQAGYSVQKANSVGKTVSLKGLPTAVVAADPSTLVQPFKVLTPEQLHLLGQDLVGEVWDGNEGGQGSPETFPALEYNTGIKVAMGGYDGNLVLKRRWTVTPTFLLVLETWAETLADDVYQKELRRSVPWNERRVFKIVTGKEEPSEAEPMIRQQIAGWFQEFYGETVDPFGPEVNEVYNLLLKFSGREKDKTHSSSGNTDIRVAWRMVLELLLSDPRIATY